MKYALLILMAAAALATAGCSHTAAAANLPTLATIPNFSLVDQHHRVVTRASLMGKPWIADFIFTQCSGACPVLTQNLRRVRQALGAKSPIRTVSFSVDPKHDTPPVLRQYAREQQAVDPRWLFLTGTSRQVRDFLVGMHLATKDQPNLLLHSERFLLVDGQGNLRGFYPDTGQDARARLVQDAEALLAQ